MVTHPGLDNALSGLSGQILSEISQQARETLEASFQGKTSVTRRALSPLKAMRDKLDGLSFVDSSFRAVVRDLDRRLATIPVRGASAHPLFRELARQAEEPRWNFHKYVIDRNGKVVASFPSRVRPDAQDVIRAIEKVL